MQFLKDLQTKLNTPSMGFPHPRIIFCDNYPPHKTQAVKKTLKRVKLCSFFNAPYSPELNLAEKFIKRLKLIL